MHHEEEQQKTPATCGGWTKGVIAWMAVAGLGSAIALPHLNTSIAPASACSAIHSSSAPTPPQQIDWTNLKTDSKLVVSYNVVTKGRNSVSLLIKQKLDNRQFLNEVIDSLKNTDMVYGSFSDGQDYRSTYREYTYSIYSEDIDCLGKRYVIKSETRYDRFDNIIITNTYNLMYDINDTELIGRLYRKYCS
jgi:hypothetical protein